MKQGKLFEHGTMEHLHCINDSIINLEFFLSLYAYSFIHLIDDLILSYFNLKWKW